MIGKEISHYKILEKLGEGGMGVVYKAHDTKLDRFVALKFLPQILTSDEEAVERFKIEAKSAAALNHPNIVTIYEIGEFEDRLFIAMEYVEGETLREEINEHRFTNEDIRSIATQLCEGLGKAHEKGIVHRDIKPENILIDQDGRVKILDFGLAKLKGVSNMTKMTSTLGTVAYMSPEQLGGKEVDRRSDIWSLGVILYEMLSQERPFKGEYEQAVTYAIFNETPASLENFKNHNFIDIKKLLEKEPNNRFQNCQEILNELNNTTDPEGGNIKKTITMTGIVAIVVLTIIAVYFLLPQVNEDKSIQSLAVLPLENLSDDPNQEYFADGITDVLISELAQISALKVISRTSVMQYKDVRQSLKKIAKDLDVDAIVEGTVFSDGKQIRITAQLIRAADDRHLWAEKYEYNHSDIFNMQNEVTRAIAGAIEVQLTAEEKSRITTARKVDPEAYQLYLKGRYHWNQRTEDGILQAKDYFNQAIACDSNYAAAYAGLADCFILEPAYYMVLPNEAYPKARAAAQRALKINDNLAEAYTSLASVRYNYDWAWSDGETLLKKAISINPNYATAHHWYAELLSCLGRFEEAKREIDLALELDPLSPVINTISAEISRLSGDYTQAIVLYNKALRLHPNFFLIHRQMAYTYCSMNQYEQAISAAQKAISLSTNPRNVATLGYIYAVSGRKDQAKKILKSMQKLPEKEIIKFAVDMGMLYFALEDTNRAFSCFEKAFEEHDYVLNYAKVDAAVEPFRSDPRYVELLRKMNLE